MNRDLDTREHEFKKKYATLLAVEQEFFPEGVKNSYPFILPLIEQRNNKNKMVLIFYMLMKPEVDITRDT